MKNFLKFEGPSILLLFAVVFIIFWPFIFGGKMMVDEERLGAYYTTFSFYQKAIENHESFLWDPNYYGGFPSYLTQFGGFLYPLHYVLARLLPLFAAYYTAIAFAAFLGLLTAYGFGRAWQFTRIGSIFLALSYMSGFNFGAFTAGLSYANGFMILPLLCFFLTVAAGAAKWSSYILFILMGGVGLGIGFLAGYPQFVAYALVFSGAYVLFLDWERGWSAVLTRFQSTLSYIMIVMIGGLLGAVQILPTFELLPFTIRTAHYAIEASDGLRFIPQLVTLVLPTTMRLSPFLLGAQGLYLGTLVLPLAVIGLIFFRNRPVLFFSSSWLIMAFLALGIPGVNWVNTLPLLSRISNPARWFVTGTLPLAWLAAWGYERLRRTDADFFTRQSVRKFQKIVAIVLGATCLALVGLGIFIWRLAADGELRDQLLSRLTSGRTLTFPLAHYRDVLRILIEQATLGFSITSPVFWIALFFIAAPVFAFLVLGKRPAWFPIGVLLFSLASLFFIFGLEIKRGAASQSVLNKKPSVVESIESQEDGKPLTNFRVATFLTGEILFRGVLSNRIVGPDEIAFFHKELLTNQIGELYGLETMFGFEPFRTLRMNQLLDTVIAPNTTAVFVPEAVRQGGRLDQRSNVDVIRAATIEEKIKDFVSHLPLLSMMNVKYILSAYPLPAAQLHEIQLPASSLPFTMHLYENSLVLPRIYFTEHPVFWSGSERDLLLEVAKTKDFRTKTFIECSCRELPVQSLTQKDSVTIGAYKNGFLDVSVESARGGWLVFSESNLPGWRAKIDNREVPIYTANYLFQSIQVPPGIHYIVFSYLTND